MRISCIVVIRTSDAASPCSTLQFIASHLNRLLLEPNSFQFKTGSTPFALDCNRRFFSSRVHPEGRGGRNGTGPVSGGERRSTAASPARRGRHRSAAISHHQLPWEHMATCSGFVALPFVTEVPRFPRSNFRVRMCRMWGICGSSVKTHAYHRRAAISHKQLSWEDVAGCWGICGPSVKKQTFVPTLSGSQRTANTPGQPKPSRAVRRPGPPPSRARRPAARASAAARAWRRPAPSSRLPPGSACNHERDADL